MISQGSLPPGVYAFVQYPHLGCGWNVAKSMGSLLRLHHVRLCLAGRLILDIFLPGLMKQMILLRELIWLGIVGGL